MSRYLWIRALQSPFAFAVDENNRTMISFNIEALAAGPVTFWEKEVAQILVDAGHATVGTDLFIGPAAQIPTGSGPYIHILNTGGEAPSATHNGDEYESLSAQITVRASSASTARTRALACWRELDWQTNVTVVAA